MHVLESALLDMIAALFRRYVVPDPVLGRYELDTLALWVAHTWCFDAAETTPYMAILGPTMRSGKSRIIEVAQHVVPRPWVVVHTSAAALYRTIDALRPTAFIDEVDVLDQSKDVRAVLNAGYRVGGVIPRVRQTRPGDFVVEDFNAFCPKMFAGIAGRKLAPSTAMKWVDWAGGNWAHYVAERMRRNARRGESGEPIESEGTSMSYSREGSA